MVARVLHISASFPRSRTDATAPFLLDLLELQRSAGWDARAVGLHDAGLPRRQSIDGVPVRRARYGRDEWEVLAFRGGGHGRLQHRRHALLLPGMVASLAAAAWSEVRRFRPEVVHAHWLLPNALVAAVLPGRHRLVVTLHGNDVQLASNRWAAPVARWVARRADVLLAVSAPLARQAEGVLSLAEGTIGVTHLPLPVELVPAPLPSGPLRLLAAGRASREKGFDVLLDALARPEASGWQATLVAEGPERADLDRRAAALGDRVRVLPLLARQELFELMRQHHVVVVPSRSEGLGLVAVEALALGRPVIASDVGGLPEVVIPGEDGMLVSPDDPAALTAALAEMAAAGVHPPMAAAVEPHGAAAVIEAHTLAYHLEVPTRD